MLCVPSSFHENVTFNKLGLWTYSEKYTHEILLVNFFYLKKKNLQNMSKEALEMQDEKCINGASVPKVRMLIMIM